MQGSVYVPVIAKRASNNINTLNDSSGGIEAGGRWLNWNQTGFIGYPWEEYWNDPNCPLKKGWEVERLKCPQGEHENTVEEFVDHIKNGHTQTLDTILGGWNDSLEKNLFIDTYADGFNYNIIAGKLNPLSCVTYV